MREDQAQICISGDDDMAEPSKNGFMPKNGLIPSTGCLQIWLQSVLQISQLLPDICRRSSAGRATVS
jgi:hypothetical protein